MPKIISPIPGRKDWEVMVNTDVIPFATFRDTHEPVLILSDGVRQMTIKGPEARQIYIIMHGQSFTLADAEVIGPFRS